MQLGCFDIYATHPGLAGPGFEYFRPLGVVEPLGGKIYTINDYAEAGLATSPDRLRRMRTGCRAIR